MNRDKFPEKVPFRLTRMMIKAMEVSGIEGNFRTTCEAVLRVLRANKDSLMVSRFSNHTQAHGSPTTVNEMPCNLVSLSLGPE